MSFFEGASNIKIVGREFKDIKGNLTVYDRSPHETNIDSGNTYHNTVIDSSNDNSKRFKNYNSRSYGEPEDNPMQSTFSISKDDGRKEDRTGSSASTPYRPQISGAGSGNITNKIHQNLRRLLHTAKLCRIRPEEIQDDSEEEEVEGSQPTLTSQRPEKDEVQPKHPLQTASIETNYIKPYKGASKTDKRSGSYDNWAKHSTPSTGLTNLSVHDPMPSSTSYYTDIAENIHGDLTSSRAESELTTAPQTDQPHKEIKMTQVVFAAEGALKHIGDSERKDATRAAFLDLQILESQYAVLAGFNEALVRSGFGFLEEIHVFCFVEIPISNFSSLLSKLGKVFTPYPGIIFTPSSGYKVPVFKEDKTIWDYDDLSSHRAESHSDINIKGILQSGLNVFTSHSGIQPSIYGHSGRGKDNRGGTGEDEGDHSDDHNDDYERSEPEDEPDDPDAGGVDSSTPAISFQVQANLFKDKSTSPSKPFQMFRISGTLAIQTFPA